VASWIVLLFRKETIHEVTRNTTKSPDPSTVTFNPPGFLVKLPGFLASTTEGHVLLLRLSEASDEGKPSNADIYPWVIIKSSLYHGSSGSDFDRVLEHRGDQ
jgi:hypothetical protein